MAKSDESNDKKAKSEEWNEFFKELQQESERGGVLLGVAFLDEHLRQLLIAFMINQKKAVSEMTEGPNAPLGSFYSRILAAYCLGLISREEYHDLGLIRRIRNRFAHDLHGLTFDDDKIKDWAETLKHPKKFKSDKTWTPTASSQFLFTVAQISLRIKLNALAAAREKRQIRPNVKVNQEIIVDDVEY